MDILDPKPTAGDIAADWIARKIGWPYLIAQNTGIIGWIGLNTMLGASAPDPYPYILLNLFLSLVAAQTGPVILIAGRRTEMLQRLILRQIFDMVSALKTMLGVLIDQQKEAKARDTMLLQHVLKAEERDGGSVKRDKEILALLQQIDKKLSRHQ